jgi:transcriptional regulator with XRE-family HTH domain
MTPFGARLRELRAARGILQRDMAAALEVSPAYLSALEHGRRGAPSAGLIHQICEFLGLIWDDADELTPEQTALGNRLARQLRNLDPPTVEAIHRLLDASSPEARQPAANSRARRTGSGRGS